MQTVKQGSRGAQVEYVQLVLNRNGYAINIDGAFGPATETAVRSLQAGYGLSADGIVGPDTWNVLLPFLRGFGYYTVKSGDTIYTIAKKFFTTPERILLANPTLVPTALPIGLRLTVPYGFPLVPTNVSYSYILVKLLSEGFQARYPFISLSTAGTSVMGQNLYYLTIGNGENEVFYNASHHANEWITTPILLKFLEDYAESFVNGGEIQGYSAVSLYQNTTLYLMPLVNPDGVNLVTGELPPDSPYYREAQRIAQNYPQIPFPDGWKANIEGIDTNLSYPAGWEQAREIKFSQGFTTPAPRDYVGAAPLAAQESAAVYRFTGERNFLLTLSYHTQGEVIYWQYQDYLPPNAFEIGELFASVSGYSLEETPFASSFAGYKDWFIMTYNRPGYTIEAGIGQNPLPIRQFDTIYKDNIGILAAALGIFSDMPESP